MRNRKLFAILTLVAFMMTLLPMAAFAGAPTAVTRTSAATLTAGTANKIDIDLTPATTIAAGDTVTVALPSNVTIADAAAGQALNAGTVDFVVKTNTSSTSAVTAATTWAASNNTVTISLTGTDTIVAGDIATISVNVTASSKAGAAQNIAVSTSKDTTPTNVTIQVVASTANEFTTTLSADKEEVDADNDNTAKFTVYVYDQYYNPVSATVYFASSRGSADTFVQSGTYTITGPTANVYSITSDTTGKAEVKVKSLVAGTAKIGFALADDGNAVPATNVQDIYNYLIGHANTSAGTVKVIGTKEINFSADSSSQNVVKQSVMLRNRTADADITPAGGPGTTAANAYAPTAGWGKANGLDYYTIEVKVTNAQGSPVPNQEVSFTVDDEDAWFASSKVTTDGSGVAKAKIYAEKADTYVVTYKTSSASAQELYVTFDPADISTIVLKSDNDRVLAKDTKPSWKFEVRDSKGNKIDIKTDQAAQAAVSSIDAVTKPDGATIKLSAFSITADTDNNWIKIKPTSAFNKVGNYVARVTLSNGSYAEFAWEIKAQGEIVGLKLSYPQSSLPMNTTSGTPTVTWVDAAGVAKDADDTAFAGDGIRFSASDYTKINGTINANTGVFTTTNNKDYVGELIVTAYDNANKISASYVINVARELASMVAEAPAAVAEVGSTVVVPVKFVDINGNTVAVGNVGGTGVTVKNAYAVTKPADATVTIEEATGFAKAVKEKGESSFTVRSTKAGEVKVFVAVDINGTMYTSTFDVTFGEPKPEIGAKNVTMFIGSVGFVKDGAAATMDQAPFIQDGRTFVPVRMVGEALGAEVEFDAATQVITLVRPDKTITMTVGSNVLTDSNGSTVVADVAPFIVAETGRTVIPFRAIAEAFGATVEAVFAADGTVNAVTFAQ